MKKPRYVLAAACFGALCAASASPGHAAVTTLTVTLNALNGSNESGTATLTQLPEGVKVVIAVSNGPAVPQPAHIHLGPCGNDRALSYGLANAVDGSSTTVVKDVTIDKLLAGDYSINLHKSAADLSTYVSCGNVKA